MAAMNKQAAQTQPMDAVSMQSPALDMLAMRARLRYRVQHRIHYLGWQGLLGLTLLLGSLLAVLMLIMPLSQQVQQQEQALSELRQRAAARQHAGIQALDRSPQAQLRRFYEQLPEETASTTLLAELLTLAVDNGLQIDKADHALQPQPAAGFFRYQITLPLHGRYVDIRRFSSQLLNRLPSAALSEISLQRPDAAATEIDARLRFTVFLRKPAV
ncbi:type 4a pilus biogenesis protein PilO [Methylobacillus flagellatus]|uniref:type 4a pilus biogenesis protein PilO n=1 Tax=Methylobacillus flagellatus TaxID=405 RepID=UPI002570AE02|nr:type 4a pilus biogenesis protein PilO [Methylobacillus flagellatus]